MPGVQKPHWEAPWATKAALQRVRSSPGSPSTVVTCRPATRRIGVTQEIRGVPSTHTVQHPHWPWGLQPSLTDRQPSSSRTASSSMVPSATETGSPLRTKATPDVSGGWYSEGEGPEAGDQLKEEPQPQVRVALGFVMLNPAPWSPSL